MKRPISRLLCDISFFAALILKLFSKGINYFPVLDDHIQYGGYPLYDSLSHVYFKIGTIVTRPFAALLDPALWGQIYPHLWIVLLIIGVLFFFGVKLISNTLEKMGVFITPFLYVTVLLMPLGFEGTYWISASSRVCVGIFFAGVASALLTKLVSGGNKWLILPYILTTVLSFGFYESVMIISAMLQFVVVMASLKGKIKNLFYLIVPFLSGIAMLTHYKLASNIGTLGARVDSFELSMLGKNIAEFFTQFAEIFLQGGTQTTLYAAAEGIDILTAPSVYSAVMLVLIITVSGFCAYSGAVLPFCTKAKFTIPIGIAFMVLPLVPNILTETVWLTYRSIVPVLFGLGAAITAILAFFLKNRWVRTTVLFVAVFVFMAGNISELDTYKRVSEKDNLLVTEVAQQLESDVLSGNKEAIVVYDENEITTHQVSFYKDHVKSVFDSDWALTGAVRAKTRNIKIKMITPMEQGLFALSDIDTSSVQIIYLGGNNE